MRRPEILVVDDSTTTTHLMTDALRQAGYVVETALTGQEGLDKTLALQPICVVLDIILPGINGYTICRRVRGIDPQHKIRILFVSTKDSPFDRSYGMSLGADQYLAKPFTGEVLVQTVQKLLPPRTRPITIPKMPVPRPPRPPLSTLIPRRSEDASLLATKNPFASSMYMDDAMYRVYREINGRLTVSSLCGITRFDMQKVAHLLKILFEQHRIEFWDPKEGVLVNSPFDYLP